MNNKKLREALTTIRDVEESVLDMLGTSNNVDLNLSAPDGGYEALGNRAAILLVKLTVGTHSIVCQTLRDKYRISMSKLEHHIELELVQALID